jgi:hypothetical protein
MKSFLHILAAASLYALAPGAHAAPVTVDFDGLDGGRNVLLERPANFYSDGLGSFGSGPGPDYGITFLPSDATSTEPRAICNVTFQCDGGAGNSLFIFGDLQNDKEHGAILHVDGGFRGIFEFDAAIAAGIGADVIVTTSLSNPPRFQVGRIENPDDNDTCVRLECAFHHYTIDLSDYIHSQVDYVAYDIFFSTRLTDAVFIDNIRFHDLILPDGGTPPTTIPEPSAAMMIGGVGLLGAMLRRRRRAPS